MCQYGQASAPAAKRYVGLKYENDNEDHLTYQYSLAWFFLLSWGHLSTSCFFRSALSSSILE